MKKKLCLFFVFIFMFSESFANLTNVNDIRDFLGKLKTVKNNHGDTFDLSNQDPELALKGSNLSIQHGVSTFLKDPTRNWTMECKPIALRLSEELLKGTSLESINIQTFLAQGEKTNSLKEVLNGIINNFLWADGYTTEVTAYELGVYFVMRQRLIDFKKSF